LLCAAEIYKREQNLSDRALEEQIRTDALTQYALGIDGLYGEGAKPWRRDVFCDFRGRLEDYRKKTGIDVANMAFNFVTQKYAERMQIDMKNVLMDSTLVHANIKTCSRAEMLFSGIRIFARDLYKFHTDAEISSFGLDPAEIKKYWVDKTFRNQLSYYGTMTYAQTCQYHINIYTKILKAEEDPSLKTSFSSYKSFNIMKLVFQQQCVYETQTDGSKILRMAKMEDHHLTAAILQSVFDLDCTYREKNDFISRGYVVNTAEAVGIESSLIVDIRIRPNITSDVSMLKEFLNALPDVAPNLPQSKYNNLITDGAYYSAETAKLAMTKGFILISTDLTGSKPDAWLAGFKWEGETFTECPEGHKVKDCSPAKKNGEHLIHMDPEHCAGCPHRDACKVTGKRVASIRLSLATVNRAKMLDLFTEEKGEAARHLRNRTEGVQNLINNVYDRDRLLFKGLGKNMQDMDWIGSAINFRRFYAWSKGFVFNKSNPLLNGSKGEKVPPAA
jgi:hypothetical protein